MPGPRRKLERLECVLLEAGTLIQGALEESESGNCEEFDAESMLGYVLDSMEPVSESEREHIRLLVEERL